MNENIFDKLDFGPLRALLDNDDITDISFDNNGQIWVRSLTQGSLRVEVKGATPEFVEKLAFQCSNVMGTTFNNAKPFLDAESAELRLNFVHPSIATNGIAMVIRKTPAKIRLQKEKLLEEDYFTQDIHDVLIKCVEGHCNIIVAGETGSGKTEFVKYLASHTKTSEKIITIEDTLELHLDKIFPQRDIVAMKTNNVASYTDVLVTCMRQNPKWILLSEVRSAEAVSAVRNSISSGHNILSTIHADKASAIPYRLYSLMETDLDVNQFLSTIYRYIQLGVHIRAYYSKERGKFHREVDEVVEFYVDENNQPQIRVIYQKVFCKEPILRKPSKHLIEYLENQNIDITSVTQNMVDDIPFKDDPEFDESEIEESREETVENEAEYQEEPEYQESEENIVIYHQPEEENEEESVAVAIESQSYVEETESETTKEAEVNDSEESTSDMQVEETQEESPSEENIVVQEVEENNSESVADENGEIQPAMTIEEQAQAENINVPLADLTNEVQVALTAEKNMEVQSISQEVATPITEEENIQIQQQLITPITVEEKQPTEQVAIPVATPQENIQQVIEPSAAVPTGIQQQVPQQMMAQVQQPAMPINQPMVPPMMQQPQQQIIQPMPQQQIIQPMPQPVAPPSGVLPFMPPQSGF